MCCIILYQAFKDAFAGIDKVVKERLVVSPRLLDELQSRNVLSAHAVSDITGAR